MKLLDRRKSTLFLAFKFYNLVLTIVLAGSLEHYRTSLIEEYGNLVTIHTIFWTLLLGVAYLLRVIWKVRNFKELNLFYSTLFLTVILPWCGLLYLTIVMMLVVYGNTESGFVAYAVTTAAIPLFLNACIVKFRNTKLLDSIKSTFTIK